MKKVRPPKTVTVRLADTRHKFKKEDDDIMREKIKIDRQLKENNRGVYGIFLIRCDDLDEQCAYIGKSEQLFERAKQHLKSIENRTNISSLKNAMDDDNLRIEIRLIESVEYKFDNYYKDVTGRLLFPALLEGSAAVLPEEGAALAPYFTVEMPPVMGVMSALVLAFVLGLGMAYIRSVTLKAAMDDFKRIIELVILRVIIPLLPFYIFGIFLSMTQSGQVAGVLDVFVKLIAVIFCMTVVLLLVQFSVAGLAARKNPLKMLRTMLTAYMTALGTQSSAATIPVTLAQTVKLGVRPELASFVVPLCATIHLSGSMMKIVACSLAVMMLSGLDVSMGTYSGFILLLGITMIAAPGVPGGAIMAAIGLLESMLGFDENMIGLMIATYIAMDSFGTATNVTGDGAIAVIVNAIDSRMIRREKR